MRKPTSKQRPRKTQVSSFLAPTGGMVSNRNLATARPEGAPPGAAVLENMFPTATGVSLRRGNIRAATITGGEVQSLFNYVSGTETRLFAATNTGIRDITTVADPLASVGPDVLTGQTSGNWRVVQFATAGGIFLLGVNGADSAFLYNGTTFGATAITFPGGSPLTTADLSYVWVYKQRIWFLQKNSTNAWYLPVDQIGGALTLWPMGGVFVRGGSLQWGHAWSSDSGGSGGLSEQCVFVTTEGEVAAYQGLSPDPGQGWNKVGQYRIGKPLGDKAFMPAGGDLVIATTVGFISLAAASQKDYAALGQSAVSYAIEDDWSRAVLDRGGIDWRVMAWPDQQMAIIAPPQVSGRVPSIFVANLNTGKWCIFTNWDVRSLSVSNGRLFFGTPAGTVQQGYVTGADEGEVYVGKVLPLFDDLGAIGGMKLARMARATVRSTTAVNLQLSGHHDFKVSFPIAPPVIPDVPSSLWDVGLWDAATWDMERFSVVTSKWVPVSAYGHDISIGMQISSGNIEAVDAELVRIDVTFAMAEIVT